MRIIVFLYLRQNESMLNYYKMLKGCLEKYVERFLDDKVMHIEKS